MKLTAIILAGGNSSRMGEDKGLMMLNGQPMIQYILDAAKGVSDSVIIIANNEEYQQFGYPVFEDEIKGKGPLGGIYTGLLHSNTTLNLILSCDIPEINGNLLNFIISHAGDSDITIPVKDGKTHQLIGIFNKRCLTTIKNAIDDDQLKLKQVFRHLNLNVVDANQFSKRLFGNINSKDDIED